MYILTDFVIAIIISIVVAVALKVPFLPKKPIRYSFDVSAVFPTPIIAIGVLSIFIVLGFPFSYGGIILSFIIGILSAFFVKYLFYKVFPRPLEGDESE